MVEVVNFPALTFALKTSLTQSGLDISHGHCQQLLAAALGSRTLASFQAALQPLEFREMERVIGAIEFAPIPAHVTGAEGEAFVRRLQKPPSTLSRMTDIVWNPELCNARLKQLSQDASQVMPALSACLPRVLKEAFPTASVHGGVGAFRVSALERIRTQSEDSCVRRMIFPRGSGVIDMTESVVEIEQLDAFLARPVRRPGTLSPDEETILRLLREDEATRARMASDIRTSEVINFSGKWQLGAHVPYGAQMTYHGKLLIERVMSSFFGVSLVTLNRVLRKPILNSNRDQEGEAALSRARVLWGSSFNEKMHDECIRGDLWIPQMYFDPMSHLWAYDDDDVVDTYGGAPYD